jgi:macrolide-specific efflux system membrane fusion protein
MSALRFIVKWISIHKIISVIAALLIACGAIYSRKLYSRSEGALSEPIKKGTIAETVYGIGTIVANRSLQIRPGQISHIDRYFCKEGDFVKRGDPLVSVDNVTSRAPFAGTITSLPFKIGENVYAQGAILTLTDLADRYMTVSLEQQGALRIKVGQKVKMSFDTIREESYDGLVEAVYSSDSNFLARIDVSRLPARILPGMNADVAIVIRTLENVLLIPVAALIDNKVWVKHGNAVPKIVSLQTGIIDKDVAEVLGGDLAEGDRLLIKGSQKK